MSGKYNCIVVEKVDIFAKEAAPNMVEKVIIGNEIKD
jgi:hypothetical protein